MVHDPIEQGDDKYNSFLSSMLILRADASDTEMLILLLYFNSSFNWIYVLLLTGTQVAVQLNNIDVLWRFISITCAAK